MPEHDDSHRDLSDRSSLGSIIDAVADLLQTAVDWLREEAEAAVHDKVVLPVQRLGLTLASAFAAGCLAAFGLVLIGVAAFIVLAEHLTYPGALASVGVVYLLAAGAFVVVKARSMQR